MNTNTNVRLQKLASKLAQTGLKVEAEDILAQIFELNNIDNVQVITPEHPLFPVFRKLLRPDEAIDEKLSNFSKRLSL